MFLFFWILLGLILGSFANVCIFRLPLEQSVVHPRSYCPNCQTQISWYQNIPLISYLVLRGRCAHCQSRVSLRYPLVEFLTAVLFATVFWRYETQLLLLVIGGVFLLHLLIISFIDFQYKIIPNKLCMSLVVIGLLGSPVNPVLGASPLARFINALVAGVLGFILLLLLAYAGEFIWKKEALGGGDIKLMAGLGVFLGWKGILITLFLGSLTGTIAALFLIIIQKAARGTYLPFGPFLAFGAWVFWMFPDKLQNILWLF